MSIILRALKKIQNQEYKQPSQEVSGGVETGDMPEPLSAAPSPLFEGKELRQPAAVGGIFDRHGPAQSHARLSAMREAAAARHRLGNVPKVLIGLIIALGVFATGWFGSNIYVNFRGAAIGPTDVGPQVEVAKQEAVTQGASSQNLPEQPPARVSPESLTAPVEKAADTRQTPVQRPIAPAAQELASAPGAIENQSASFENTSVGARPAGSEGRRSARKEARPERKGRPAFKINAIAWRAEEPKAIVNMQRVFVGDVIEGATVKAIQRKSILFEYEGETFEVRF